MNDIRISIDVPTTVSRTWRVLTDPRFIARWLGDQLHFDPRMGGRFVQCWTDGGREVVTLGTITRFEPPHALELTWADHDWPASTMLRFALEPSGDATRLTLVHDGWEAAPDRRDEHEAGWREHLARLVDVAASLAPPSGRAEVGEYADYAQDDIDFVQGDDAVEALLACERETLALFAPLSDEQVSGVRYAHDKWTMKEVLGHLTDDERIFVYRMLTVARGDETALPGFDENAYMTHSPFESRPLAELLDDYRIVRRGTISMLENLPREAWSRRGNVNGYDASVRGMAFHVAGHELHHLRVLREKYLG